jgi:hypothetical protein
MHTRVHARTQLFNTININSINIKVSLGIQKYTDFKRLIVWNEFCDIVIFFLPCSTSKGIDSMLPKVIIYL